MIVFILAKCLSCAWRMCFGFIVVEHFNFAPGVSIRSEFEHYVNNTLEEPGEGVSAFEMAMIYKVSLITPII